MKLLGLIGALVIAIGIATAFFVRQGDLNRVERLERIVRCQKDAECREFVERAIREILREQGVKVRDRGVTFHLESSQRPGEPARIVAEGGDFAAPKHGQVPGTGEPEKPPKPSPSPNGVNPEKVGKVPQEGAQTPVVPIQPLPTEPQPAEEESEQKKGPRPALIPEVGSVAGKAVEELPCTAIREVHDLC
jgi:hypothetical protein